MKRISLILALSIFVSYITYAQTASTIIYSKDLNTAIAQSNKKNTPILLYVNNSKEESSSKMNNLTFRLSKVINFVNDNFTSVNVDVADISNNSVLKEYRISVLPTYIILDSKGAEISRFSGYSEAYNFIEKTKVVMDPDNSAKVKKEAFDNDHSFKNYCDYAEVLHRELKYDQLTDFVESYLYAFMPVDKYSEQSWKYLKIAMRKANSRIFYAVLSDKYIANSYIGKSSLDKVIAQSIRNYALEYVSGKGKDPIQIAGPIVSWLAIVDDNSASSHYINIAFKLFNQRNMQFQGAKESAYEGIASYLSAEKVASLEEADRNYMIKFFKSIEGMPEQYITAFETGLNDYFKKNI
ncbi:hypothetical protein [Sphingobacterium lumbrici]|uniref:hypothetical protein n=1 Tax=Sphingobacterium lumbrici TaxID=2559600 RepID=UPI00112B8B3E|nr:hypothetical protein [Sphingobacterium lumbrici]